MDMRESGNPFFDEMVDTALAQDNVRDGGSYCELLHLYQPSDDEPPQMRKLGKMLKILSTSPPAVLEYVLNMASSTRVANKLQPGFVDTMIADARAALSDTKTLKCLNTIESEKKTFRKIKRRESQLKKTFDKLNRLNANPDSNVKNIRNLKCVRNHRDLNIALELISALRALIHECLKQGRSAITSNAAVRQVVNPPRPRLPRRRRKRALSATRPPLEPAPKQKAPKRRRIATAQRKRARPHNTTGTRKRRRMTPSTTRKRPRPQPTKKTDTVVSVDLTGESLNGGAGDACTDVTGRSRKLQKFLPENLIPKMTSLKEFLI